MNMLQSCSRWLWLGCLPAILGMASTTFADDAEGVSADQRLPPGVLAYLSISDVETLKNRFGQSNMGQLINDASLNEFRQQFVDKWNEAMEQGAEQLGFPPGDLLGLPTGELAIAAVQPAGQDLSWIVLMDVTGEEDLLTTALAKAEEGLASENAEKQIETIEETDVTVYSIPAKGDGADPHTVAWFTRDGVFVVGGSTSLLEAVLVRWDGEHSRTFADSDVYSYIYEKCQTSETADPLATWFIDPIGLVNGVLAANEEMAMQSMMVAAYLPILGLDGFKGVGGSFDMATEDFDTESRTFLYAEQPTKGILKVFEFPAVEMTPPAWVSADVSQYTAVNWNLEGAYGAIETLYDMFTKQPGAFEAMMEQVSKRPGTPMLHPKQDLVDQFTGLIHVVGSVNEEAGLQGARYLVALDLKDDAAMQEIIERIADSDGVSLERREFEGTTIYEAADANAAGAQPCVAVHGGHLLFATAPDMLEAALRDERASNPLATSDQYTMIAENFPEKLSILGYQKQDAQLKMLWDAAKSGQFDAATEGKIDLSTLPDFEAIQDYLTTTGSYAVPDENGALFVNFGLRAEK